MVEAGKNKMDVIFEELKLKSEVSKEIELREMLSQFEDVFALSDVELGCTGIVIYHIETGDSTPIKQLPYRTAMCRRQKISEFVEGMQK